MSSDDQDLPSGYKERFCAAMFKARDHISVAWDIAREFGGETIEWDGPDFTITVKTKENR